MAGLQILWNYWDGRIASAESRRPWQAACLWWVQGDAMPKLLPLPRPVQAPPCCLTLGRQAKADVSVKVHGTVEAGVARLTQLQGPIGVQLLTFSVVAYLAGSQGGQNQKDHYTKNPCHRVFTSAPCFWAQRWISETRAGGKRCLPAALQKGFFYTVIKTGPWPELGSQGPSDGSRTPQTMKQTWWLQSL